MLAAHALDFGTCCIGWARPSLRLTDVKDEIGIPAEFTPVLPIVVGYADESPPPLPRRPPRILRW